MGSLSEGHSCDLESKLKRELEDMRETNGMERANFVSEQFLRDLFTPENLKDHFSTNTSSQDDLDDLVDYVSNAAKRTYAILLLINEPDRIYELKKSNTAIDEHLFKDSNGRPRTNCVVPVIEEISQLKDVADRFYETQWLFPPCLPSEETKSYDSEFFMLPFKTYPKYRGSGANGEVYEVEIDRDYFEHPITGSQLSSTFAYKRVRKPDDDLSWDTFKREINVVKARSHPHITPIFASFVACTEFSDTRREMERLYLIMPLARLDMKSWIKHPPTEFISLSEMEIEQHIWDTIEGLTSALAFIHREIGSEVGYHGDIKPTNILLFKELGGMKWKLSDFGSGNLKDPENTGTGEILASQTWQPEEYDEQRKAGEQIHGRLGDVWSLGCVFLILATMIHYKWRPEGVQDFHRQRKERPFHKVQGLIKTWIQHLSSRDDTQERNGHCGSYEMLLSLIKEMLSVQRERLFSWEVSFYLYRIRHQNQSKQDQIAYLEGCIQQAREIDEEMYHKPLKRARAQGCEQELLRVLMHAGWYDERTTSEQKLVSKIQQNKEIPSASLFAHGEQLDPATQDLLGRIADAFCGNNTVALYGLRGTGKTLIAKQYIDRVWKLSCLDPDAETFLIPAETRQSFQASYCKIATGFDHAQDASSSDELTLCKKTKQWLEGRIGTPWLMLLDGLDRAEDAKFIKTCMPSLTATSNGKILITTKNRALVKGIVDLKGISDIEIVGPSAKFSMKLFRQRLNRGLWNTEGQADSLLRLLPCPELIEKTAVYMNAQHKTCTEIIDDLQEDRMRTIECIRPDLATYFLVPVLADSLDLHSNWSEELQLLYLLAMFDNQVGLDKGFITSERESHEHWRVQQALSTLTNCSFIRKTQDRRLNQSISSVLYHVHPAIQIAVLAWVENNERGTGSLEGINKALGMLSRSYDNRQESKLTTGNGPSETQSRYMAHFKHIAQHVSMKSFSMVSEQANFIFTDRAIRSIAIFSHILVEEGKHGDAVTMLKLGQKNYSLSKIIQRQEDGSKKRGISLFFELNRKLIKTQCRKEGSVPSRLIGQMRTLILDLESVRASSPTEWKGKAEREWHLLCDLVRLLWKRGQYDDAIKELKILAKIKIIIDGKTARLPGSSERDLPADVLEDRQKLAINARREEGVLHLAIGQDAKTRNDLQKAKQEWRKARQAFYDARGAIQHWFGEDSEDYRHINLLVADANTKVGNKKELDSAIIILEDEYNRVCKEHGEDSMQARCRKLILGITKWTRGDQHGIEAIGIFSELRPIFEKELGRNHARTRECTEYLQRTPVPRSDAEEDFESVANDKDQCDNGNRKAATDTATLMKRTGLVLGLSLATLVAFVYVLQ